MHMGTPQGKVLAEWIGYCGGTTIEKRNGVPTEIEHDEIWAICYTSDAHVIVRHGAARSKPVRDKKGAERKKPFQPFKASPDNPVPLKELTDRLDSLEEAERAFRQRIEQKTDPKRKGHQFHPIAFEQPPYHIESFVRYLGERRRDEDDVPVSVSLQTRLEILAAERTEASCPRCGVSHPVIDLGEGVLLEPGTLLGLLKKSDEGQQWLVAAIRVEQDEVIEAMTHQFLGRIITASVCAQSL